MLVKHFTKRDPEVEEFLANQEQPSKVKHKVFTKLQTKQLLSIFKKAPKAGPEITHYKMFDDCLNSDDFEDTFSSYPRIGEVSTACSAPCMWNEGTSEVVDPILKNLIGDYKLIGGKFNLTLGPYRLHTDSGKHSHSKIYKQIIIPLLWDVKVPVYTMLFNQRWTGSQARFQRGVPAKSEEKFETATHLTVTDYENSDIKHLTSKPFDVDDYNNYLTHINYESLWGFSIELAATWKPQSLIYYDRSVIHSSCHFANSQLSSKLFLTLVTEYPDE